MPDNLPLTGALRSAARIVRRAVLGCLLSLALLAPSQPGASQPGASQLGASQPGASQLGAVAAPADPEFRSWASVQAFRSGVLAPSTSLETGPRAAVTLAPDRPVGSWTSPVAPLRPGVSHLNPSWQADTPPGTVVIIRLAVRQAAVWSGWYGLGSWTLREAAGFRRTSVNGQRNAFGAVETDTFVAAPGRIVEAYRIQVVLRSAGIRPPRLYQVSVQASRRQPFSGVSPSAVGGRSVDLAVPGFSQYAHSGEFPSHGGGGEAWCSPVSTAMVMAYWGAGPSAAELAGLPDDPVFNAHGRARPLVVHAALHTYDPAYRSTGNWPFNTAYAAAHGLDAAVRVFRSLRPIEWWVLNGVPIVVSIAWNNRDRAVDNDLPGAGIPSTPGHLLVVRGFTAAGDVITNDPATPLDAGGDSAVRRVYPRAAFERQWINASGGTTYVIATRGAATRGVATPVPTAVPTTVPRLVAEPARRVAWRG